MTLKQSARTCIGLGFASFAAVVVSHLALTDIYHGEGNLSLEWTALRVSGVVLVVFQAYAVMTLRRVARARPNGD